MSDGPQIPDYKYVAYIDEAGDPGLQRVLPIDNPGSAEWLLISAVVVPVEYELATRDWIKETLVNIRSNQRTDVHFARLPHNYRLIAASDLLRRQGQIRCFVVCSNKKNMRRWRNIDAEKMGVKDWFYCWLTRVALERVTHFVAEKSLKRYGKIERVKLVFSERGGLNAGQIYAYYDWIKQQSLNDALFLPWGDLEWGTIHPRLMDVHKHQVNAGLQLADITASAFFQACDNKQSGPCVTEYAKLLRPLMGRYPDAQEGLISGYGVKLLPYITAAKLDMQQEEIFLCYGYPTQLWQHGKIWNTIPPPSRKKKAGAGPI